MTSRLQVQTGGIGPLVELLGSSSRHAKKFASTAFARLSHEHEATQLAIAQAGAIVPLVGLLDGRQGGDAQQEAAGALYALAESASNRHAITASDGIGLLVALLASENHKARAHAKHAHPVHV